MDAELKNQIEQKIKELELKTSLEFVPVVATQSSTYLSPRILLSLVLSFFTFCFFVFEESAQTPTMSLTISAGVGLAFYFLLSVGWLFRLVTPRSWTLPEVSDEAHRVFLDREVFATRQRTGILIFVSELEHAVFVLADKGVAGHLKPEEWSSLGEALANDLAHRGTGKTFLAALDQLGERLTSHFPPNLDNPNELSDRVIDRGESRS